MKDYTAKLATPALLEQSLETLSDAGVDIDKMYRAKAIGNFNDDLLEAYQFTRSISF